MNSHAQTVNLLHQCAVMTTCLSRFAIAAFCRLSCFVLDPEKNIGQSVRIARQLAAIARERISQFK